MSFTKLAVVVCVISSSLSFATTMIKLDTPALIQRAEVIVRGTVVRTESKRSSDGMRIYTATEVRVDERFKGQPGAAVTVLQPGGEVGDISQQVAGVAHFKVGEEVVLFLEKRGDKAFGVVGMAQGKRTVIRGADGGVPMLIPEPVDATVLDPTTRTPVTLPPESTPLDTLRGMLLPNPGKTP